MSAEKRPELILGEPPTAEEKEELRMATMLKQVLQIVGTDENKLESAVKTAIHDSGHVENARFVYLKNELTRRAKPKIRNALKQQLRETADA